jgi:cysteinyl-tRNA synthetase
MLKIYNTLSAKKETFYPINQKQIGIYVCGMTVYDYCHIGHARILVMFDVIVRHLRRNFPSVKYVRNITDIDDKIINRSIENKEPIQTITERFIKAMHEDEKSLYVLAPDVEPRATDSIDQILYIIESLMKKNIAYQGNNGDIYYSVRNFENYGKLSKKKLDELKAGNRVNIDTNKKDPLDFTLWKIAKPNEPSWESPWGAGRPGWHIECSAMSTYHLGNNFDIHGGGIDLVFPHNENEIAQSEGANSCSFANNWIHVGFVNINDEKMSKSLNNFHTIRDVLKKYDGQTIRYFIISSHYRSPLNFSYDNLDKAKSSLRRLYTAIRGLDASESSMNEISMRFDYATNFNKALNDDFNTPIALSILFDIAKKINSQREKDIQQAQALSKLMKKLGSYLGILTTDADVFLKQGCDISAQEIDKKIKLRNAAKAKNDFSLSDKIRDELLQFKIILEDKSDGTTSWRIK